MIILVTAISGFFFLFMLYIRLPVNTRNLLRKHRLYLEILLAVITAMVSDSVTGLVSGLIANMLFSLYVMAENTFIKTKDSFLANNNDRQREYEEEIEFGIAAQKRKIAHAKSAVGKTPKGSQVHRICRDHLKTQKLILSAMKELRKTKI